jgi:hypothetical protein
VISLDVEGIIDCASSLNERQSDRPISRILASYLREPESRTA